MAAVPHAPLSGFPRRGRGGHVRRPACPRDGGRHARGRRRSRPRDAGRPAVRRPPVPGRQAADRRRTGGDRRVPVGRRLQYAADARAAERVGADGLADAFERAAARRGVDPSTGSWRTYVETQPPLGDRIARLRERGE